MVNIEDWTPSLFADIVRALEIVGGISIRLGGLVTVCQRTKMRRGCFLREPALLEQRDPFASSLPFWRGLQVVLGVGGREAGNLVPFEEVQRYK